MIGNCGVNSVVKRHQRKVDFSKSNNSLLSLNYIYMYIYGKSKVKFVKNYYNDTVDS